MTPQERIVERLPGLVSERYGGHCGILLYGSAARGECAPDSDVDVLVFRREAEGMEFDRFLVDGIGVDATVLSPETARQDLLVNPHGVVLLKLVTGRFLGDADPEALFARDLAAEIHALGPPLADRERKTMEFRLERLAWALRRNAADADRAAVIGALAYGQLCDDYPRLSGVWSRKRTAFLKELEREHPLLRAALDRFLTAAPGADRPAALAAAIRTIDAIAKPAPHRTT